MEENKVVVTGVGVVSSIGIGKDNFFEGLLNGRSGIKKISLFDTSEFKAKSAGQISDFKPEEFLGEKGLRLLDRSTKLVNSAAKLALDDGGVMIDEINTLTTGVVVGNTFGSLKSICDFDKEAVTTGPQYVNPALFPNTVINSPASQISIKFNIKGFNATISNGFSSSLDAISYASNFIRTNRADMVLAGGVEELCLQSFLGLHRMGRLSGLNNAPELCCPFDKRRNGLILGEGAGIMILESLDSAVNRKAKIYAQISGFANGFSSSRRGLRKAIELALDSAGIEKQDIDYICAAAQSDMELDAQEAAVIKDVFQDLTQEVAVTSIKSMTGECISASGVLQLASSLCAIEEKMASPIVNYEERDPDCDLNYIIDKPRSLDINNVLINSFGPCGTASSMVVSKI